MATNPSSKMAHLGIVRPTTRSRPLVGNFEENILNNRLQPDRVVEDYSLEVRSAAYNRSLKSKVRVSFFSAGDSFPYLGQAHIGQRAYKIPKKGTLQVTLFNPNGTLVKLFLLHYDLTDMPPNSQTFLRQKTLLLVRPATAGNLVGLVHPSGYPLKTDCGAKHMQPRDTNQDVPLQQQQQQQQPALNPPISQMTLCDTGKQVNKSLPPSNVLGCQVSSLAKRRIKYMIQLNIVSSKSNRIYLNKDLRIFISKKLDLETATQIAKQDYEVKSFDEMPSNPRYFSR